MFTKFMYNSRSADDVEITFFASNSATVIIREQLLSLDYLNCVLTLIFTDVFS